jgi:hypothetical protein
MLRQISELKGMPVRVADEGLGEVCDVYVDPESWTAKYLVVDRPGDLQGRYALVAPSAVATVDWRSSAVQFRRSQDLSGATVVTDLPKLLRAPDRAHPSLHSAAALAAAHADGADGSLGHVIDLLYDERTWTMRYLLLDTECLVPDSHLLLSMQWIESVSFPLGLVFLFLSRNAARQELLAQLGLDARQRFEDTSQRTGERVNGWHWR